MNDETLYQAIFRRRSVRSFIDSPLPGETLDQLKTFIGTLKPLFPEIRIDFTITDDIKNMLPNRAPHYILVSSERKDGSLLNVGFMLQQVDLWMSAQGLGSCWLGIAKPAEKLSLPGLEYVIALAIGKPSGSPYRELSAFSRKPLDEISSGSDVRLECARLAPSASNSQNWFFESVGDGSINIYRKKLNPMHGMMYDKMNTIDAGIAICHLYLATLHAGKPFAFKTDAPAEGPRNYIYMGTVN